MVEQVIGDILGRRKLKYINSPSKDWILPDTMIGIEVELEKVAFRTLPTTFPGTLAHYWDYHEDPSLHDHGTEFTFRTPMFGEDAKEALSQFFSHAVAQKWNPSRRCGIHVHVDARDMSRSQLLGFLSYYLIFEPALYAWVGDSRHANNFCLPFYKTDQALDHAASILLYMRDFQEGRINQEAVISACDGFHKYSGLNLKSLATYGSIEFRQLKTCLSYNRVKDWINILFSLKKAALEAPESTLAILHQIQRTGIRDSLHRIFGNLVTPEMETQETVQMVEDYGIPNALYLLHHVTEDVNSSLSWQRPTTKPTKLSQHKGLLKWKETNFPKDEENNQEKIQSQTIAEHMFGNIRINFNAAGEVGNAVAPAPATIAPPALLWARYRFSAAQRRQIVDQPADGVWTEIVDSGGWRFSKLGEDYVLVTTNWNPGQVGYRIRETF